MSIASMRIPNWLKPENGPIGRGFVAFLDHAPEGVTSRVVMMWFVILYTAFAIVTSGALGVDPDSLTSFVLGLRPAAGYAGHEPLAPWLAGAWFRVLPRVDWAFHLLTTLNAVVGLFFAHRVARLFLDGDKAIAALLVLLLTPFYTIMGQSFSPADTMLATWPAATLCFLRAFTARDLMWSALAGVTSALAVLGDYHSLFLVAGFALAVIADPRRGAYLRSVAPWLALAVAAIAFTPHAAWLWGELQRAGPVALAAGSPGDLSRWGMSRSALGALGAAILAAVCLTAVRGRGVRDAVTEPDGRMLLVILAAPLVLPLLAAPFMGGGTGGWLLRSWPAAAPWFLVPVILFRPGAAVLTRTAAIRIAALTALATVVTLAAAPWLAWHPGETQGREFYQRIAAEATKDWRLATGQPLRVVTGDTALAAATAFYSSDQPDPQTATAAGDYVAICGADDAACVSAEKARVAANTNVQFNSYTILSPYPGKSDRLGRFFFILVPRPGSSLIHVPDAPR
jgi:hypothetical protein